MRRAAAGGGHVPPYCSCARALSICMCSCRAASHCSSALNSNLNYSRLDSCFQNACILLYSTQNSNPVHVHNISGREERRGDGFL